MNASARISLIAQGVRRSPTGYIATCDRKTQTYEKEVSPDQLQDEYYQSIIGDDIWLAPVCDSSSSVSNMACMFLTGQAVYDSVRFFRYDREKHVVRFPTIKELEPVMNILCIKYSATDESGIEFR